MSAALKTIAVLHPLASFSMVGFFSALCFIKTPKSFLLFENYDCCSDLHALHILILALCHKSQTLSVTW